MAAGDFKVFNELAISIGEGKINLETDTIKLALITSVITPTQNDATPAWGASSGVDYDTNEVSTAGGYSAGGFSLPTPALTRSGAVSTFDYDGSALALAQDAGGFTNARWGILYSDTATNKEAIGYLDLGGDISEVAGPISIAWAAGIATITVS